MTASNVQMAMQHVEGAEYMFQLVSGVLPSLCSDFKPSYDLRHTYVHPVDALFVDGADRLMSDEEVEVCVKQFGINYLLDKTANSHLIPLVLGPNSAEVLPKKLKITDMANPVVCTHAFRDLPPATRALVMLRTSSFEAHARVAGGYVRFPTGMHVKSPISFPALGFDNTYLLNLIYADIAGPAEIGFRARMVDGIIVARDLLTLLNVRALLTDASRTRFDAAYDVQNAAAKHGIVLAQAPQVDTEITTMNLKYLLIFFQFFENFYTLRQLTFNGQNLRMVRGGIASLAVSIFYQSQLSRLTQLHSGVTLTDHLELLTTANTRLRVAAAGMRFVDISANVPYYITLLSMLMRADRTQPLIAPTKSLFWDGIEYSEFRAMSTADALFIGSTCYTFALYDHDDVTYCSVLSDALAAGKTPLRVCFYPRVLGGKTVAALVLDTLTGINLISPREFPRRSTHPHQHIGLSHAAFMKFFQMLRVVVNREPEVALKEVLMAYAGIRMEDSGPPHYINKESYMDFLKLLFGVMGFRVHVSTAVYGSRRQTSLTVSPSVTKHTLTRLLAKVCCGKEEVEKIMASAHDLLQFMVTATNVREAHGYHGQACRVPSYSTLTWRFPRTIYGGAPGQADAADAAPDVSTVVVSNPLGLLERINSRGIFSASTVDELMAVDGFLPENTAFKNNLRTLIDENALTGENILMAMPNSMIDRLVTVGGAPDLTLSSILDDVSGSSDDAASCVTSNEIADAISSALKTKYVRDTSGIVNSAMGIASARSEKQLDAVKRASCSMSALFKQLTQSVYTTERIFGVPISDEVKSSILERYKLFVELSKSLYMDMVALENLKALLLIVRRSGRYVGDSEIGVAEMQKAYDMVREKISRLTSYYSNIGELYWTSMKRNLNMRSPDSAVSFDSE
ncbi:putative virion core protein P4a precursor [Parapoxvirus red deer/HL953]|uniref:Putative virion core protein P4a n=1 Tax=Parapoxvirus red deer/HL953 TaxID=1579460 RepID=A0A0A7MC58_9POXV|nr:putative virion core protein P4a precursor [Parapoxvirus red deer/HL953]AIZ77337.1 putative virion core protein P4a precursor [Parapoxvirus red deer/HL953]